MRTDLPKTSFHFIDLGDTTLHCVNTGQEGPPLILVPALVSKIDQWLPLAQYMGRRFNTFFFELPGHGQSSPYPGAFSTYLVPQTVEALANRLGFDRFSLMGFSFGGLLALRTLDALLPRIERMILVSPALDRQALRFSPLKRIAFKSAFSALKFHPVQRAVIDLMHGDHTVNAFSEVVSRVSKVDKRILVEKEIRNFPQSTLDVMAASMNELLSLRFCSEHSPFSLPCFFGMSLYDDLLDYHTTLQIVSGLFTNLKSEQFTLPYHQPPTPFTYQELLDQFGQFLEMID